jgi:hypothetical protein
MSYRNGNPSKFRPLFLRAEAYPSVSIFLCFMKSCSLTLFRERRASFPFRFISPDFQDQQDQPQKERRDRRDRIEHVILFHGGLPFVAGLELRFFAVSRGKPRSLPFNICHGIRREMSYQTAFPRFRKKTMDIGSRG